MKTLEDLRESEPAVGILFSERLKINRAATVLSEQETKAYNAGFKKGNDALWFEARQSAIRQVKLLNKILVMVPHSTVNTSIDGTHYRPIYELLNHETDISDSHLGSYAKRNKISKEDALRKLNNIMVVISEKKKEQEMLMALFGLKREEEDFGNETFLHVETLRDYLIKFNNISEADLK